MVRIPKSNTEYMLYFPKNRADFVVIGVDLYSEVTGQHYNLSNCIDQLGLEDYFTFLARTSAPEGEYVYTLYNVNEETLTGLLRVGELEPTKDVEYKKTAVDMQYRPEF